MAASFRQVNLDSGEMGAGLEGVGASLGSVELGLIEAEVSLEEVGAG